MKIYLIGSLREPGRSRVQYVAECLRVLHGFDVFDDWLAPGPEADDKWQEYEQARGRTFVEALRGYAAENVFFFDYDHLSQADAVVLVMPAGKSAHLELGWAIGMGKPGFILLDGEPERWDVMYRFAAGVYTTINQLVEALNHERDLTTRRDQPGSARSVGGIRPPAVGANQRWG